MKPDSGNHNPDPRYLRELIKKSGLTQNEAARKLGISERMMRYYLQDEDHPTRRPSPYVVQYALEGMAAGT